MTVAIYVTGAVAACCIIWLFMASAGLDRGTGRRSWRRVWIQILAATASVATFLMVHFIAIEAPVSASVVIRGWVGFLLIFAVVFTTAAALIMLIASPTYRLSERIKKGSSAGRHA